MQKRFAALLLIHALGPVTVSKAGAQGIQPAQSADIAGQWVFSAEVFGEPVAGRLILKVEGKRVNEIRVVDHLYC